MIKLILIVIIFVAIFALIWYTLSSIQDNSNKTVDLNNKEKELNWLQRMIRNKHADKILSNSDNSMKF